MHESPKCQNLHSLWWSLGAEIPCEGSVCVSGCVWMHACLCEECVHARVPCEERVHACKRVCLYVGPFQHLNHILDRHSQQVISEPVSQTG